MHTYYSSEFDKVTREKPQLGVSYVKVRALNVAKATVAANALHQAAKAQFVSAHTEEAKVEPVVETVPEVTAIPEGEKAQVEVPVEVKAPKAPKAKTNPVAERLDLTNCEAKAVEDPKSHRWYITLANAGYMAPWNRGKGYKTFELAVLASEWYAKRAIGQQLRS